MDTVQSFDAEFDEEPDVVLLNLKNLLFAYRWQTNSSLNYIQWLISVTNDCFFYFLKKSEPMYAYHSLVIAEFYIKSVLYKSVETNEYEDIMSLVYQKMRTEYVIKKEREMIEKGKLKPASSESSSVMSKDDHQAPQILLQNSESKKSSARRSNNGQVDKA